VARALYSGVVDVGGSVAFFFFGEILDFTQGRTNTYIHANERSTQNDDEAKLVEKERTEVNPAGGL
jgi:hypothetical protein